MRVMFVTSPGGHLQQLLALRAWWESHERSWVTLRHSEVEAALEGETIYSAHFPTTRNVANAIRNFGLALSLMRRERPDVVVSNGAGISVPFFLVAKAFGARTVYIECFDRITMPTLSGRICYPLSDVFCVQWDEQLKLYPDAVNIGSLL